MLGVEVDLQEASVGLIRIRTRKAVPVMFAVSFVIASKWGHVRLRDFAKVAGRIQFSDAQVMGRSGKLALADLRAASMRHATRLDLGPTEVQAFQFLIDRLSFGSPRIVPVWLPLSQF